MLGLGLITCLFTHTRSIPILSESRSLAPLQSLKALKMGKAAKASLLLTVALEVVDGVMSGKAAVETKKANKEIIRTYKDAIRELKSALE
jgi:hypothetical protein